MTEFARDGGPDIGSFERRDPEETLTGESARVGLMLVLDRSDWLSTIDGGWLWSRGAEGGRDALLPMVLGVLPMDGNAGTGGGGFFEVEGNTARR